MNKIYFTTLSLFLFGLGKSYSQQSFVALGNNATGSGGSASYSVGQIAYITSGSGGTVTQGVQQPYEITTLGVDDFPEITLAMKAYPNPATDILTIAVEDYETSKLTFQLIDIMGRNITSNKLSGSQTTIDMSNLNPAVYFVKITDGTKEIKTFKIIKK